VQALANRVAL
jgi:hypothetical protein